MQQKIAEKYPRSEAKKKVDDAKTTGKEEKVRLMICLEEVKAAHDSLYNKKTAL